MIENPNSVEVIVTFGDDDIVKWDDGDGSEAIYEETKERPFESESGMTIAANSWTSLSHTPSSPDTPFMSECKITCTFSHIKRGSATTTLKYNWQ